jgi:hypothetical protein
MRQTPDDAKTSDWAEILDFASLSPYARVFFLLLLRRSADVVMLAAELNIADHLAERPRTASELAELTGCHPESLRRVLLTAAALGIFAEQPDGRVTLLRDRPQAPRYRRRQGAGCPLVSVSIRVLWPTRSTSPFVVRGSSGTGCTASMII